MQLPPIVRPTRTRRRFGAASIVLSGALATGTAHAQVHYSIDWHGPTKSAVASTPAIPITEGDLLRPPPGAPVFGPLANPAIAVTGGQLGLALYGACDPSPPHACQIEIDALSFGREYRFPNTSGGFALTQGPAPAPVTRLWYSVDEFATSFGAASSAPSVRSESLVFDACADLFTTPNLPVGPLPPTGIPAPINRGVLDGNGLVSGSGFRYRGIGLEEPNPPGTPPDPGDNVDAVELGPLPFVSGGAFYFSLDASFIDPLTGLPNTGSAAAAGFRPGAVLRTPAVGGTPVVWATPFQLGLDLDGTGTDDLDALILWENGNGVFNRSIVPYDWTSGATDMLLFSVRRGSSVIGKPDSIFGIPIEPGDLLTTPPTLGARPGIFIAAENLGLATARTHAALFGDEMDAAASAMSVYFDCNDNDVEDAIDIANETSSDNNKNGIPDECEKRKPLIPWPK
jgi:hypothetical protein